MKVPGGVVELFADVLADPLELASAGTVGVVRLMMDRGSWKLGWQRRTLGLLARLGYDWCRTQSLEFGLDGRDVRVDQLIEQADLVGT